MDIALTLSNRQISPAVVNLFQFENGTTTLNFTLDSYMYGEVNLRNYKAYAVTSINGNIDMTELAMSYDATKDKLTLSWDVKEFTLLEAGAVVYQIVFKEATASGIPDEGENTAVFYSYKATLINREAIDGDNEISAKYPTILKQWLDRMNALGELYNVGVIYMNYGESILPADRLAGRLYFQYTDALKTKGQFEDDKGNVLTDPEVMHLFGKETIAGEKTFTDFVHIKQIYPVLAIEQTDTVRGETPSIDQDSGISFNDKAGTRLAYLQAVYTTAGDIKTNLFAYKPQPAADGEYVAACLSMVYPASGDPYATAPTPLAADNSDKIATTEWSNAKFLPLSGGTMSGNIVMSDANGYAFGNGAKIRSSGTYNENLTMFLKDSDWKSSYVGLQSGMFAIYAGDGTNGSYLMGKTDGTLTWAGKNIAMDGNVVHKTNNETISGQKTWLAGSIWKRDDIDITQNPTSNKFATWSQVCDKNNTMLSYIETSHLTDGTVQQTIGARKEINGTKHTASLSLRIDSSGNKTFALSDNPPSSSNGAQVATTYWANAKFLPKTGGAMTVYKAMYRDVNDSYLAFYGGTGAGNDGAQLDLCGANHPSMGGIFQLHARNADVDMVLRGRPDGGLTWDGTNISAMSMPSGTQKNLTLGSSGTKYTAPADGWICLVKKSTGTGHYIHLSNDSATSLQTVCVASGSGATLAGYVPVKQGDSVNVLYTAGGTTTAFFFVYAEGQKHLA